MKSESRIYMNSIKKHLKLREKKVRALIQAHIDAELAERLKKHLSKEKITIVAFIEAAAAAYLEEK